MRSSILPYFEVVNDDEKPVFVVSRDGVRVFDKAGVPRPLLAARESGYFTATSGLADASMTATGTTGSVQFVEDGLARLVLSGNDGGGSSLLIPSGDGVIAGFGASKDGPGTLLIGSLDRTSEIDIERSRVSAAWCRCKERTALGFRSWSRASVEACCKSIPRTARL